MVFAPVVISVQDYLVSTFGLCQGSHMPAMARAVFSSPADYYGLGRDNGAAAFDRQHQMHVERVGISSGVAARAKRQKTRGD